ncbi:L-xylulose reductase-like [Bolinopsis microptera]|uniref:L-xylulose reductase-like n=1 Tax=Bolinopsis microptera TaxID=2820187 RepID=UPI003079A2C9
MNLGGKNILVTGGGAGIGRGVVTSLSSHGANVYVISRSQANLDTLLRECSHNVVTKTLDITEYEAVRDYILSLPPLDGLVNNAATAVIRPFLEITTSDFDAQMDVNVKGNYFVAQAAAQNMVNNKKAGSIVHVSSQASQAALQDHSLYGMSKAALDNLAKNMALELGSHGIRVNCVNPTVVMTDMGRVGWSDPAKAGPMLSKIPLGRFAEIEEVVGPILFLLSDSSSMVNGTTLPIDGGFLAM